MAVDQQGLAMKLGKQGQLTGDGFVIGTMDLLDPALQLLALDRLPPQAAVPMGAGWHQPKSVARPGPDGGGRNVQDGGGVDLFFIPVAVDDGPRHGLDDRAEPGGNRSPYQPVNQRVLERFERTAALDRIGKQRILIIPSRMGHGQQHGKAVAG